MGERKGLLADTVAAMVSIGSTQPINTPNNINLPMRGLWGGGDGGDGEGRRRKWLMW